jgi:hypothetical protein
MTGFIPVKRNSNTVYTAGVSRYFVPASDGTALYIGDPVSLAGSADTLGKYPTVTAATLAANNQWCGVVVAVLPVSDELKTTSPSLDRVYRPASTAAYVLVADDPDQEFMIGEDAVGAALAAADIGNLGIAITATANTTYGRSQIVLDSSTFVSGTATGQLKLLGMVDRPDLSLGSGTTSSALWRVKINEAMHELATPATTEP